MKNTVRNLLALTLVYGVCFTCLAQEESVKPIPNNAENTTINNPVTKEDTLEDKQRSIHDQWKQLEETLLRMAETTATTDPDRAELIKKVVALGKQKMIDPQFKTLTDLLKDGEIGRALDNQKDLRTDLADLLKVLETENRMRRIKSEKERLKGYIKELEKLIAGQKNLQNRTMDLKEEARDEKREASRLSEEQARLSENAESLKQKIDTDEGTPQEARGEKQEAKEEDTKARNEKQETKEENKQQSDKSNKNDEDKSDKNNTDTQSESSDEPSTQDRLNKAQQKMKEAQQKLEKAQKEGAVEKQEEALRELEKAKSELEEILRQLREEEEKRKLAQLETRFKKMIDMQKSIYESTQRLDSQLKKNDGKDVDGTLSVESVRLSSRENVVLLEANKALLLLQEDGTAVAMTEALTTAVEDMQGVVELFNKANVGAGNQTRQENILATLEELLDAVKREQKEQEEKEQNQDDPNQDSANQSAMEGLVDKLSELKMIRSMQLRINKSTQRCQKLITGPTAQNPEVLNVLTELSQRQERLRQILHDLSIGKNK